MTSSLPRWLLLVNSEIPESPPKLVLDILQFSAEGASENTVGETECNNNSFEKKIEGDGAFPYRSISPI